MAATPNTNGGSLYVFLDGLQIVDQRGLDFEVVMPDVPGHVQRAGGWLGETDIAKGNVLRLRGVVPGTQSFPVASALGACTIYLQGAALTSRKRAATIWLPKPRAILSLCHATVTPPDYVVKTASGTLFPDLAAIHVLVYDYADENEVALDGHEWEPCRIGKSISLHLISTSPRPEGKEHELHTEAVMFELVSGYPGLIYRDPRPLTASWIDPWLNSAHDPRIKPPQPTKYGDLQNLQAKGEYFFDLAGEYAFALAEVEHFTSRSVRLERLGRMKQAKFSIADLWRTPDILSERPSNCMTVVVP